jgi:hypothetical protein
MLQMIILPRQARDKHTAGKPQNREARFLAVHGGQDQRQDHPLAAVRASFFYQDRLWTAPRARSLRCCRLCGGCAAVAALRRRNTLRAASERSSPPPRITAAESDRRAASAPRT